MQFNLSMISTSMKIRYSRISTRKYVEFCCANGVPPKSCPHRYTAATDPVLAVNATSEQTQIETLAMWKGLVEVCLSRRKQVQDFKNQTNAKQGQFISIHIFCYFYIYIYKYICTYLTETGRNRGKHISNPASIGFKLPPNASHWACWSTVPPHGKLHGFPIPASGTVPVVVPGVCKQQKIHGFSRVRQYFHARDAW